MIETSKNYEFSRYQLPAILVALVIFIGSSIPAQSFPSLSIFKYDKVIHFVLFFVFCFFTHRAVMFQDRIPFLSQKHLAVSIIFTILYGALDEGHQAFVPGRSPDVFDLLADSAGAAVCALVIWLWFKFQPKAEQR
jgi:VanZ family protein